MRPAIAVFLLISTAICIVKFNFSYIAAAAGDTVQELNTELDRKRDTIDRLKREISTYEQSIRLRQTQAASLANQLAILNDQIQRLELTVKLTSEEISQTELEIRNTETVIAEQERRLLLKRSELAAGIRNLWQREQTDDFTILLSYDNVAAYFNDLENIAQLQATVANAVREYERLKKEAELKHAELKAKEEELTQLAVQLNQEQTQLSGQRSVKAQILVETRRSETAYQSLLAQTKREHAAIEAEVSGIEKKIRTEMAKGEKLKKLQALGNAVFDWPVPQDVITAYFHDPDYPYRYIFEHPAIDIKSRQGSPVKAAVAGYVAKAKNAGMGYSYVMIIHNDGFATVYGHLSKVLVSDDEFVSQGQVIGLSGGTPGTPGAGRLTTGPHLHFEIRQQGIPINPLDYLL